LHLITRFLSLIVCVQFLSCASASASDEAVKAFVDGVNESSNALMKDGTGEPARERTRALLSSSFDVPWMARYTLDKAWETASPEKQAELLAAFEEEAISGYLRRMSEPGTKLSFIGQRPPLNGDRVAASKRVTPGKEDETWIWRLRPDGDGYRIVDVTVDGFSALNTTLNDYGRVWESSNGDFDAVIAFMRKRAAE
jgi:phospholipid transport system substrate-binding protein